MDKLYPSISGPTPNMRAGAASAGVGALSAGAQWLRNQTITVPNTMAHYGANVARWMYPDLGRAIVTGKQIGRAHV